MCSIITVNREMLSINNLMTYLDREAEDNSDGFSIITQSSYNGISLLRTMSVNTMLDYVAEGDWDRIWIHLRYSTGGEARLSNTHGWMSNTGIAVMHNGILRTEEADAFPVDSQVIVKWINQGGIPLVLQRLAEEDYANCFLVNTDTGEYNITRNTTGTLYTDGMGNYSTNALGSIRLPVIPGSYTVRSFSYA